MGFGLVAFSHAEEKLGGEAASLPVKSGPWGIMEVYDIDLEPPENYVSYILEQEDRPITWCFTGIRAPELPELLKRIGLNSDQIQRLSDPDLIRQFDDRVEVIPPRELVKSLTSEVRVQLYQVQSMDPEYPRYQSTFYIDPRWRKEVAEIPGIQPQTVESVTSLFYPRGRGTQLSELPLILGELKEDSERRLLVRSLLRERSLAVRLKIEAGSDHRFLTEYWSARGKNQGMVPLMEAVLKRGDLEHYDLVHLLPPLPRMLLYTYRDASLVVGNSSPDCFWTAANFFNQEPSGRFLDDLPFASALEELYHRVSEPSEFGDLVLMIDETLGYGVHACNYIAGDLVFTKNGRSFSQPWVINTLEEVIKRYSTKPGVTVKYFRLNSEFSQKS